MVRQHLLPFHLVDVWHGRETCSYMYEPQQSALWLQMIPFPARPLLNSVQDHAVACLQMLESLRAALCTPYLRLYSCRMHSSVAQSRGGGGSLGDKVFVESCENVYLQQDLASDNTFPLHYSFVLMYLLVHTEKGSTAILYS